jgi:hypothetical protein
MSVQKTRRRRELLSLFSPLHGFIACLRVAVQAPIETFRTQERDRDIALLNDGEYKVRLERREGISFSLNRHRPVQWHLPLP